MEIPGYIIQREIGKGGMATVYLAIQESLNRPVVLKILDNVDADKAQDLTERFMAEGRIIASLTHPNIITIYDIGVANRMLYISMEYVQGGDLKQRLELPISEEEALDILAKVSRALSEAHKHGIVHRDVKPANILFRDAHTPLLTDFGIAKQVDNESDLTSTGIFLGSPNYVSPEQADGMKIDGRADIYSLGCIFYEMLTGKKPYSSTSVIDIVIQHKQAPVPKLPPELAEYQPLLDGMMAKKRDQRIHGAESLVEKIEKLQRKHKKRTVDLDFDVTGTMPAPDPRLRNKRANQILVGMILLGMVLFSTLEYVDIRLKTPAPKFVNASTQTVLTNTADQTPVIQQVQSQAAVAATTPEAAQAPQQPAPALDEVLNALTWLGNQSLQEFKLTYPPKDNAYYYFGRLLELDPGNQTAIAGILEIAEQYAVLAEQAMVKNETEKMKSYIEIGLKINPDNRSLLSLKGYSENTQTGLMSTIKSFFN
jgi:serine/threonine protein kinase